MMVSTFASIMNPYRVNEKPLNGLTEELGGCLADPLKTTVVQNQRSMATWVVRKDA